MGILTILISYSIKSYTSNVPFSALPIVRIITFNIFFRKIFTVIHHHFDDLQQHILTHFSKISLRSNWLLLKSCIIIVLDKLVTGILLFESDTPWLALFYFWYYEQLESNGKYYCTYFIYL